MPVKICCVITKSRARSPSKEVAKWKAFVGGAETDYMVPRGMKALSRQIFVVGYLQFVKIQNLHAALCSNGYGVASSTKEPAQAAVRGLYRNTAKEWFRGDIRNVPSTRWCLDPGGNSPTSSAVSLNIIKVL